MSSAFWDQVEGNWKQLKGKVQERWGELTNDEIDEVQGRREQLIGRIQERYGIEKAEANRQIDEWAEKLKFD